MTYAANGRSGGGRGHAHGVPSRGVSLHRCRSGGGLEDGLGDLLEDGLEDGLTGVIPAVAAVVSVGRAADFG